MNIHAILQSFVKACKLKFLTRINFTNQLQLQDDHKYFLNISICCCSFDCLCEETFPEKY